ncbi:MAG TPA: glycosyltransferase N-terminal domain-containing protein [Longimicrobiales bacterium]|nr:glycosyltransferase N-terminal domain-containing protein [Longimicrobiales bacterium]
MHLLDLAYDAIVTVARPVIELSARGERAQRAVAGRRQSLARFRRWARESRDTRLPLVWVHSPSVGEALMAGAIIAALRESADVQVAFTIFSPSAERVADRVGADVHAYLPWDTRRETGNALAILEPSVIAFVRTEIWPSLVLEAKSRRARSVLVNAPLAESSSRLRPLVRPLLGVAYRRLDAVGAVSLKDVDRFARLGVPRERIQVTGDARFDQVIERVARIDRGAPLLRRLAADPRPAIVAGSTWPADEDMLVAASPALLQAGVRLILAPHEPTDEHLSRLDRVLDAAGISHARLAAVESDPALTPDAVVIDRVGALADVYSVGRLAWVGGGFGSTGLHSVIEPAALGVPVMFGPAHGNAREAAALVAAGGGALISKAEDIGDVVRAWLAADGPGRAAAEFVVSRAGGAERNARIILDFLPVDARRANRP